MMLADDVALVVTALAEAGVAAWLDGGWGVDALLGEQTREHDDLDLVMALADAAAALEALASVGYSVLEDELPTRLVVAAGDRSVDLHTVTFDDGGGGVQILQDGSSWRYPTAGFAGRGEIAGRPFACLTAEVQLLCHVGYEPDATDRHDVRLLARRFGLPLPHPYR